MREFVMRHDKALRNPGARCTDRIKVEHVGTLTLILEPEALAEAE